MTTPTPTKPSGIIRNTFFVSEKTGIRYWVDQDGKATPVEQEQEDPTLMCECEIDWNCPLHQGQYTAIERMNDEWASRERDQEQMSYYTRGMNY